MSVSNGAELRQLNSRDWQTEILIEISALIPPNSTPHQKDSNPIHILLSGGSTPLPIYSNFNKIQANWSMIQFSLADERLVPLASVYRSELLIRKSLTSNLNSFAQFPSLGSGKPEEMLSRYSETIQSIPFFHLAILGIGEDGHTASLFPGNDLGDHPSAPDVLLVSNSPKPPKERITLSLNKINQSEHILFLVSGSSKREIIERIQNSEDLPVTRVRGKKSTTIFYCTD